MRSAALKSNLNQPSITKKMYRMICTLTSMVLVLNSCSGKKHLIHLNLDTRGVNNVSLVEVYGSEKPLSWNKAKQLTDDDGDGVYNITLEFNTSKSRAKIKFSINGVQELIGSDSRSIWFKDGQTTRSFVYNEFLKYDEEKINSISYTPEQIQEDVALLKEILEYTHPNIYKFRDSGN